MDKQSAKFDVVQDPDYSTASANSGKFDVVPDTDYAGNTASQAVNSSQQQLDVQHPSALAYLATSLGKIPQGLLNVGKNLIGTGQEFYNNPSTAASNLAQGAGSFLYHLPANLDIATGGQPYSKYYPNIQSAPDVQQSNAFGTGNFLASVAPVGKAAQLGERGVQALSDLLPQFAGKNFLNKAGGLAAGGALAGPVAGVSPQQGALSNVALGGLSSLAQIPGNYVNKLGQAYRTIAPGLPQDLQQIPKTIYQKLAAGYMGLKSQAGNIYNAIDQDPRINNSVANPITTFNDAAKGINDDLANQGQTHNVKEQQAWVSNFVNRPVNNFQDYMNRDKELNDLYKTEDVQSNPGLVTQYAKLKNALDQHADQLGSTLPDDLKQQYGQAKSLWKQAAQYETLPENTDASEWFKQFQKERNPNAVANGETDSRGYLKGNPGNFLKNTFDKSDSLADQSAKVNHLTGLLDPEDLPSVASAYLNPNALKKIPRADLADRLNNLNGDTKQMLFGADTPTANTLQAIANSGWSSALARHATGLLGAIEGAKLGHPGVGYVAGYAVPSLFERKYVTAPKNGLVPKGSANNLRRQFGYLPGALSNPNQNQLGNTP